MSSTNPDCRTPAGGRIDDCGATFCNSLQDLCTNASQATCDNFCPDGTTDECCFNKCANQISNACQNQDYDASQSLSCNKQYFDCQLKL